jgi:2-methylcitrate dehydratase PrpD
MTAAETLGTFVARLDLDGIPEGVAEAARLHALDTLGCGLAAHALGEARYASLAAVEDSPGGSATAIGVPGGLPASEAALVNGTLCHALDFDDTHPDSVVHVSAAVVPAALAAAEARGSSGREVLTALVAGSETSTRVGMAAGGRFHAHGFHATGVCGVFAAAAAAARLRGLDAATTTHALGIAGSMASGLLEFLADGSETKRLHPGWAAHAGLTAARLAAHGATGPSTVLEGRRGLYGAYVHGEAADPVGQVADLGERWTTPEIAYKPYAACHYVHAPVDALATVLREHRLGPEDVESIVAFSDETGVAVVLDPPEDKVRPRTAYDAKFSLPYCLAARLVHGALDVASFTEDAIRDPAVLAVTPRVRYEVRRYAAAPDAFPGGVRVHTVDGRTLEAELRHQRGAAENPLGDDEVRAKYRANAALALSDADGERLEQLVLHLEQAPDVRGFEVLRQARVASAAAAPASPGT